MENEDRLVPDATRRSDEAVIIDALVAALEDFVQAERAKGIKYDSILKRVQRGEAALALARGGK